MLRSVIATFKLVVVKYNFSVTFLVTACIPNEIHPARYKTEGLFESLSSCNVWISFSIFNPETLQSFHLHNQL